MKPDPKELTLIFQLLQENATLGEVSQFLKTRGVHYSAGSWEQLFEERLITALDADKLSREDLINLLRLTEEHGKQHVFLFKISGASVDSLIDPDRIKPILKEAGLSSVLQHPRILDKPSSPTIADVRWEPVRKKNSFILKVVKLRVYPTFVDTRTEGEYLIKRYRELKVRAVNVCRLSSDGVLELRLYSHPNSSDYRSELAEFWSVVQFLLPRARFKEWPITKAKTNLWANRAQLQAILRYSNSNLRNSNGTELSAASGSEQMSLFDDLGASRSLDEFLRYDAYCDSSNVWWLKGGGRKDDKSSPQVPDKDTHVLLSGSINEFALTAKCLRDDYEYVLDQIKRSNA
jgi:hypothetical protein